jgi:hypothetical protein
MMITTANFPQYETKVYQTSRRNNQLPNVDANWLGDSSRQFICGALSGLSFAPAATWHLHTTQPKYFASTSSEVVNLTGLL